MQRRAGRRSYVSPSSISGSFVSGGAFSTKPGHRRISAASCWCELSHTGCRKSLEPLGLAVGARRVRPGAFVSEPSGRQRRPESLAEIGRTVIGHDPFDGHPLPGKPAEGALEKADRAVLALVRQDLAVSQPGRVIDAHMQRFPADAVMAIDHAARSAGDAMPDPGDTPKLLGIEMDQLAGPLALVSYHRRLRVERGQLAQTEPAQDRADRGNRHAQLSRNGRSAHPLPPQAVDLANPFGADAVFAALRCRAAIGQCRYAAASVPRQPAIALPFRNPGCYGGRREPPAATLNPLHQQESTWRRQARILVNVHPGDPPIMSVSVATHSLTGLPRMNNLHSNDT